MFCGLDGGEQACCAGCLADLPWIVNPCRRCGAPLPQDHPLNHCVGCRMPTGGSLRVRSALVYEYPVDRIIAGAKFRQRLDFAAALGGLLGRYLCGPAGLSAAELPDVVIPVPLHRRRLATRGFNQAAEIAAPVAERLGLLLCIDACTRVRHTIEQTSLTGRARRRNLVGAFVARHNLAGLRVAIVDDVLTTGTTVRAVAAAVMKTGARDTQIWTVTRTD
jgi:ComF family protein